MERRPGSIPEIRAGMGYEQVMPVHIGRKNASDYRHLPMGREQQIVPCL
jgi:hypothetical protein